MEGSRPATPTELGTFKTSLIATPGIEKLMEKSQVSEDGTLRSLEPAPQLSSADGSPAEEVGAGDPWSWARLGAPFLPGLGGVGLAKALWPPPAEGQAPSGLWGGGFHRPSLFYWSWA